MKNRFSLMVLLLGMASLIYASKAVATAYFYPTVNNSRFVINGKCLQNVGSILLDITYDQNVLFSPSITWGSFAAGGVKNFEAKTPGKITMSILSTSEIKGTGEVAYIAFLRGGASKMVTVRSMLSSPEGVLLPSVNSEFAGICPDSNQQNSQQDSGGNINTPQTTPTYQPPPAGTSGTSFDGTAATPSTITAMTVTNFNETLGTSSGTLTSATVSGPTYDERQKKEAAAKVDADSVPAAAEQAVIAEIREPAPVATKKEQQAKEKFVSYKSVLQRFKEFSGERTSVAMTALFTAEQFPGFSQDPPIVLSDGKATVIARIAGGTAEGSAPNFALNGARLVALKPGDDGFWLVEARPDKGVVAASVTMILENKITEYPLTVAPPVSVKFDAASEKVTEADFLGYLQTVGSERKTGPDLNGDGKLDYIDDYIYTANYLAITGLPKKAEKGAEKQPVQKQAAPVGK